MSSVSSKLLGLDRDVAASDEVGLASKKRLKLWLKILKVSRRIEGELRDRLRTEFGSTLPRFDVMAALDRTEDGLRMSELSGVLKVSNGNVTGIVDRLVMDGLVERLPVEGDRRAMTVRLTKQGRKDFSALAAVHESWVNELFEQLDAEQATELANQLGMIANLLDEKGAMRP